MLNGNASFANIMWHMLKVTKKLHSLQIGETQVLITTLAFGMGIPISDVINVIHWGLPDDVLDYWQGVGQCTRDGRPDYFSSRLLGSV